MFRIHQYLVISLKYFQVLSVNYFTNASFFNFFPRVQFINKIFPLLNIFNTKVAEYFDCSKKVVQFSKFIFPFPAS